MHRNALPVFICYCLGVDWEIAEKDLRGRKSPTFSKICIPVNLSWLTWAMYFSILSEKMLCVLSEEHGAHTGPCVYHTSLFILWTEIWFQLYTPNHKIAKFSTYSPSISGSFLWSSPGAMIAMGRSRVSWEKVFKMCFTMLEFVISCSACYWRNACRQVLQIEFAHPKPIT